MQIASVEQIRNLAGLGNVVPASYTYYQKVITPNADLALPTAYLKWYDLYPTDAPITPEQVAATRAFLIAEVQSGRLQLESELGFVILHRAGSVLLLLLTVWRSTNEMWESTYMSDATGEVAYERIMVEGNPRGTYCVWELGAVWHERNAWVRFLKSERVDAAKLQYVNDRFEGTI